MVKVCGLLIHSSCIWRWVQIYWPELDKHCRAHLKRTNKSYRVDETYIRIKGQDRYLYRAVGIEPIRLWRNSRWKAHYGGGVDCASAST
jgi:transposase-like protein